ncbi:hypothetical protein FOIG_16966 [Fusarium odoratissimum NRRL 54006]|uniref:Uncharacterized protein n=1 Tax=Fusarium odoratissimum (strain NRRL 54006) TaxID=1089451 RepID=X0JY19_FUSO5|nr:uncharacterized protein FOIG_16966 [Fusarium odoratissimum NRRL 54006]EXL89749.1 hypothetical protein FOIG_16966 [Fusarium odoratissimum NRRL 54006]
MFGRRTSIQTGRGLLDSLSVKIRPGFPDTSASVPFAQDRCAIAYINKSARRYHLLWIH